MTAPAASAALAAPTPAATASAILVAGDLAFAGALAALPRMRQPLLRRLLGDGPARSCWEEVRGGRALQALARVGVGAPALRRLEPASQGWAEVARAEEPEQSAARWAGAGISILRPALEPAWGLLADHPSAPAVVFCRGRRPGAERPRVAILGTRSCTHYGEAVAGELARALAASGAQVVSGLDQGIEAVVQRALLGVAGPGLAVVAGGVGGGGAAREAGTAGGQGRLAEVVARQGALLSEAPPGAPPERWRYFRRNLLLALSADVLVVVEAHGQSGVLSLAETAAAAGVAVGAVPGSVRSAASVGTNRLLADGAQTIRGPEDVIALLSLSCPARPLPTQVASSPASGQRSGRAGRAVPGLPAEAALVLSCLEETPTGLDLLLSRSRLCLEAVVVALEALVEAGLARPVGAGYELAAFDAPK